MVILWVWGEHARERTGNEKCKKKREEIESSNFVSLFIQWGVNSAPYLWGPLIMHPKIFL